MPKIWREVRRLHNELEATRLALEKEVRRDLLAYIQPLPKEELQRLTGTMSSEVLDSTKGLVLAVLSGIGEGVGVGGEEEKDGGGRGATTMTMAADPVPGAGSGMAGSSGQTLRRSRLARPWRSSSCGSCGWAQPVGSGGVQGVPSLDDSSSLPSIVVGPFMAGIVPVPAPLPMPPTPTMPQVLHALDAVIHPQPFAHFCRS